MNDKKTIAKELEKMGRGGDTMLAHINPQEAQLLKMMGGSGTINPVTGLPEFWNPLKEIKNLGKSVETAVIRPIGQAISDVTKPIEKAVVRPAGGFLGSLANKLSSAVKQVAPILPIVVAVVAPALIPTIGASILGTSAATAGLAEIAAGSAVVSAATTAASGGNIKQIAISAVTAAASVGVGGNVAQAVGTTLANAGIPAAAVKVAASAVGAAAVAKLRGQNVRKAAISGALGSAGAQLYTSITTQPPAPIETVVPGGVPTGADQTTTVTPIEPTQVSQAPTRDQEVIDLIQREAQNIAAAPTAPIANIAAAPPTTVTDVTAPTIGAEEPPTRITIEGVGDRTPEEAIPGPETTFEFAYPETPAPEAPAPTPETPTKIDTTTVPDLFGLSPVTPSVPVTPAAPPVDYGLVPETPTGGAPGFSAELPELPPAEAIGETPIDYGDIFAPATPSEGFQPEVPSVPEMGGGTGVVPGEFPQEPVAPEFSVEQPPTAIEEGYPTQPDIFEEGYPTEPDVFEEGYPEEIPQEGAATGDETKYGITRLPRFRYPSAGRGSPLADTGLFGPTGLTTTGLAPVERGRKTSLDEESTEEPTGTWGSQTLRGLLGI